MSDKDERTSICNKMGFEDLLEVHQAIMEAKQKGIESLVHRGLTSRALISLGYDVSGMTKLGFSEADLQRLGYISKPAAPSPSAEVIQPFRSAAPDGDGNANFIQNIRNLIEQGYKAAELRQVGVHIHHCKISGLSARELYHLGFFLDELVHEYPPGELRMAGFHARELYRFFPGQQLRSAGYSAGEMRSAGFSIRDLRNFGYSDNHIIGAGFSNHDLAREGLSKHVKEKVKFGHR